MHAIFDGSTSASLPEADIQKKYGKSILFAQSKNHWCNHKLKVRLMRRVWEWKTARYLEENPAWSRERAEAAAYVHQVDCWPVNLTALFKKEVKEQCPGIELMYQAAGGTGLHQVNDTHFHSPYNAAKRRIAHTWLASRVRVIRAKEARGELTAQERVDAIAQLLRKPMLRRMQPGWMLGASACLTALIPEEGRNLIAKAWAQNYFDLAEEPTFQAEALAAHATREKAAVEAATADALAAAQSSGDLMCVRQSLECACMWGGMRKERRRERGRVHAQCGTVNTHSYNELQTRTHSE